MYEIFTKDLFLWIRDIKNTREDIDDLYLLLDLIGGISKSDLLLLKINSKEKVNLKFRQYELPHIYCIGLDRLVCSFHFFFRE